MSTQEKIKTVKADAQTIWQQIGGNRFKILTGCYNFVDIGDGISMKLRRNKSGANYLKIRLRADDTYLMSFLRYRMIKGSTELEIKVIKEVEMVYCDKLQEIFTEVTRLYTHL